MPSDELRAVSWTGGPAIRQEAQQAAQQESKSAAKVVLTKYGEADALRSEVAQAGYFVEDTTLTVRACGRSPRGRNGRMCGPPSRPRQTSLPW